jgi:hypothetical protein
LRQIPISFTPVVVHAIAATVSSILLPTMDILTAVICDSAADYNGKLCILGTFDTIYAQRFPAVHPHCALALRIVFRPVEEGIHRFRIVFIDPDGHNVLPPDSEPRFEVNISEIPDKAAFVSRNFVISLQGLPLEKPSLYSFDVHMDEQIVARIPLQVISANPPG